ncbi:MAG: type II toxin-antitoxin system RelE/ParE family toxin [Candidatus Azobacteroides sp.]|nr:type II toxin-antitoxin system RelE/ParE family toxin [Candidatus Azobacteroides sp.]
MEIIWLPEAENILDKIFLFYFEKSESAAKNILRDIYKSIKQLKNFPYIASKEIYLKDADYEYHSLVVRKIFKIIYRVEKQKQQIIIVTIWDCRQNPDTLSSQINNS